MKTLVFKDTKDQPVASASIIRMPTVSYPFKHGKNRCLLKISGWDGVPPIKEIILKF